MTQTQETSLPPRWQLEPQWYLWEGGFLGLGRSEGAAAMHSHHAFQLVIALDGKVGIKGKKGEWRMACGLVVPPDIEHSFDGNRAMWVMIFVDPESSEGAWLRTTFSREITLVPDVRLSWCIRELRTYVERPLESIPIRRLIQECVSRICTGAPPSRRPDERVSRVLKVIRESEDLRLSLEAAAEMVHLSPGRFAHLFKQQVGLPFRRYLLWRKLARAVLAVGREPTLAAAAHAADFADAAHLTRTFYRMFGLTPSTMMQGRFFEIDSPFSAPE